VFAEPFLPCVRRVGADGRVTSVAGTGVAGSSGDGGAATNAQLNLVHGVASLPDGSLVLADTGNNRLRKVSPTGVITTVAGTGRFGFAGDGGLATAAELAAPRGIASLPDGSVLFPDSGNHRVRLISTSGVITTVAGNGAAGFSGDGGPATSAQLHLPFAVSPLPGGGFLIADAGNNRIRRVDHTGTMTTVASHLSSPHAVAALPDGGFLVADTMAHRVLRVSPHGPVTTVAGTGTAGFSGDGGPAATAALNHPKALAVLSDLSGFLVGDAANNRVRVVRIDLRPPLALHILTKPVRTTAGRAATLRYSLSEPAATTLEVRRRGSIVLRVRQPGKHGTNRLAFGKTLRSGTYALRLRATAGARTTSAAAALVVRKKPK
jgi:glucose/arabinose dehydrogenase